MTEALTVGPIYEVVTGSILLSARDEFFRLHSQTLLPIMRDIGIAPVMMLVTEIGDYGQFLDIYRYESLADYERLTDRLLDRPEIPPYYKQVGQCIAGSIRVQIMRDLPYAMDWTGS